MSEPSTKPLRQRLREADMHRLLFLADGVFAIALTLAALEIRPPHGWDGTVDGLWTKLWPSLSAYFVSFVVIAAFWASHKRVYSRVVRVDARFTGINLVLLGLVALIPAATQLLYEYAPHGGALVVYAGLVACCGLVQLVAWAYAAFFADLVDPEVGRLERIGWAATMLVAPAAFGAVTLLGEQHESTVGLFIAAAAMVVMGVIRRRLFRNREAEA